MNSSVRYRYLVLQSLRYGHNDASNRPQNKDQNYDGDIADDADKRNPPPIPCPVSCPDLICDVQPTDAPARRASTGRFLGRSLFEHTPIHRKRFTILSVVNGNGIPNKSTRATGLTGYYFVPVRLG